jgi:GNAT superfamily N-acetyltransferase
MLIIRRAMPADAHVVSEFGRRTFLETFGADNTPENMAAYLAEAFSETRQSAEIADDRMITLVAEDEDQVVGYAQLALKGAPACVNGASPIELVRFYVDRAWHGRGIAQALMHEVDAAARPHAKTIWLGVWERNLRAIAFYEKSGFVDVGAHTFQLGTDRQIDRIMARSVATAPDRPSARTRGRRRLESRRRS